MELNNVAIFIFRFAGMGNLIKVLTRDIDHNAAHFFLDFESKSFSPSQLVHFKMVTVGLRVPSTTVKAEGTAVAKAQSEKGLHVLFCFFQ